MRDLLPQVARLHYSASWDLFFVLAAVLDLRVPVFYFAVSCQSGTPRVPHSLRPLALASAVVLALNWVRDCDVRVNLQLSMRGGLIDWLPGLLILLGEAAPILFLWMLFRQVAESA